MNIDDAERTQILREIGDLRQDFERLYLADVKGFIETYRKATLSRTPIPKPSMTVAQLHKNSSPKQSVCYGGANGIELGDKLPRTLEEWDASPTYYARNTGVPILNSAGSSLVLLPGWTSSCSFELSGTHAHESIEAIKRGNQWVRDRCKFVWWALFPDRSATFSGYCWPDVVLQVAETVDASTSKTEWFVTIGSVRLEEVDGIETLVSSMETQPMSLSIDMWRRRHQDPILSNFEPFKSITVADELYIGDEPEIYHCKRDIKTFLRDSELALDWLRRKVERDTKQNVAHESKAQSIVSGDGKKELDAIVGSMEKRLKLAYLAAQYAEQMNSKQLSDRQSFDWLKENGVEGYTLPGFDTFTDYLTKARKHMGEQRKTPRAGRPNKSIVKQSEI